nr:hypothetical protein [Tanacetum cinerariifolium]
ERLDWKCNSGLWLSKSKLHTLFSYLIMTKRGRRLYKDDLQLVDLWWDVIENGNSFIPVAQTTTNADGTTATLIPGHVTTKEKTATVRTVDNEEQEITATVDGKEFTVTEAYVRRHVQLADVDGISVLPNTKIFDQLSLTEYVLIDDKLTFQKDGAVYEEWDDSVERSTTTTASLDAKQASDGSPRCQEAIGVPLLRLGLRGDEEIFEQHELTGNAQQQYNDPPLSRGHTLRSGEDSIELIKELMETCIKLSERVLDLEESKTTQDLVITRLKLRVTKLEKKMKKARTPQPLKRRLFKVRVESSAIENLDEEDPSKQGRSMIEEIDQDAGVTLFQINAQDQERFDDDPDFDAGFYKVSTQGEAHSQEDQLKD